MVSQIIIGQILSGSTLSAIIWGLSRFVVSRRQLHLGQPQNGFIAPSQTLAFVITALSFAAALFFFQDFLLGGLVTRGEYDESWTLSVWLGAGFLLVTAISATSFTTAFDVTWTATDLTGPISYKFPPFGPERMTLRFDEITEVGMDAFGSFYVKNAEGARIRWGWTYAGYRDLMRAIEAARPDLFAQGQDD